MISTSRQTVLDEWASTIHPQIYVAGGHNGETILNTAEKFEPDTELWMTLAPMNMER